MFSTRETSSMHTPPGMHTSRRLQLEQVTSNFCAASVLIMLAFLRTATVAMVLSPLVLNLCHDLEQTLEVVGLVEEAARTQRVGKLPVREGGVAGKHVDLD